MLKMPTKTLLISAVMILFAGCTTKQLPRPTAEIEQLRAQQPPAEPKACPILLKANVLTILGAQRVAKAADMKVWIFLLRKTRRYAVPRPAS